MSFMTKKTIALTGKALLNGLCLGSFLFVRNLVLQVEKLTLAV